ncbi:MAG: YbjQ family protein [Alphaproteobacteria bacterium]|nr:YbjQ family protein [Alphaproteobacteria bacterium]
MYISSNETIKGRRILYTIGKINASSSWHAANSAPLEDGWQAIALKDLIRKAEEIDADAIVGLDYETDSIVSVETPNVRLKRILITGKAVKLSCLAA